MALAIASMSTSGGTVGQSYIEISISLSDSDFIGGNRPPELPASTLIHPDHIEV